MMFVDTSPIKDADNTQSGHNERSARSPCLFLEAASQSESDSCTAYKCHKRTDYDGKIAGDYAWHNQAHDTYDDHKAG